MKLLFAILDFLFPHYCLFCGKLDFCSARLGVCKICFPKESLPNDLNGFCKVCKSILADDFCEFCNSRNVFFEKLEFVRWRSEKEKKILRNIKFHSSPHLSNYFRIKLAYTLSRLDFSSLKGIVVIPSNKKTLRSRPIHPTSPVIKFLQKRTGAPILNCLEKISPKLQSSQSYRDRFIHARFAFQMKEEFMNSLNGSYLLIDDIFTTGASLNESARILLENGASKVQALVLARGKN